MTYPSEFEFIEMERRALEMLEPDDYRIEQMARDILRLVAVIRDYQNRKAAA